MFANCSHVFRDVTAFASQTLITIDEVNLQKSNRKNTLLKCATEGLMVASVITCGIGSNSRYSY